MFTFGVVAVIAVIVVSSIFAAISRLGHKSSTFKSVGCYGKLTNTDVSISDVVKYLKLTNSLAG